ncbi:MAG: DUF302 domain-containing protein [Gammaproteobacteria bacterium]|nr:DUF302 domain-containing protein [Gammaproteobacteria bacterium]
MTRIFMLIGLALISMAVMAAPAPVFEISVKKPMDEVYTPLYKTLEDEGFYVVFEANIGRNMSRFSEKWGENYNRNQLDGIRSMVFCNVWYANAVSNADPRMLALCPLRLSLLEKSGATRVLFARPTVMAADSPALKILTQIENEIIAIIRKALN